MNIVFDTNVFVSGIFFSGPPHVILNAWQQGKISLVVSPDIFNKYRRVGLELARKFPGVNMDGFIELVALYGKFIDPPPLFEQVCSDSTDDKFIACALAAKDRTIISGDKALLRVSGYQEIKVLSPRQFVNNFLIL